MYSKTMMRFHAFTGAVTVVAAVVGITALPILFVRGYSQIQNCIRFDRRSDHRFTNKQQQQQQHFQNTNKKRRYGFQQRTKPPLSFRIVSLHSTVSEDTILSTKNNNTVVAWNDDQYTYQPLFDFSRNGTVDMIERLDDAIMGGISTSLVQVVNDMPYARWTGVCRTDGGGFCGFRTNPFVEPLMVDTTNNNTVNGFYIQCRLSSDDEPERRIWKLTTRTKPDRGELLYQAPFVFPKQTKKKETTIVDVVDNNKDVSWSTIRIPFDTFRLVRGPRVIQNGPALNVSTGLYQIGMTMSKFIFNSNTSTLENFRDGYFEVQLREIGVYSSNKEKQRIAMDSSRTSGIGGISPPKVYTKDEAKKKRPVIVKVLLPISKLFFSEASNRRRSAMRILTQEKNMTRMEAIQFGMKSRTKSSGIVSAWVHTMSILFIDAFRSILFTTLRVSFLYPILAVRRFMNWIQGKKPTPPRE